MGYLYLFLLLRSRPASETEPSVSARRTPSSQCKSTRQGAAPTYTALDHGACAPPNQYDSRTLVERQTSDYYLRPIEDQYDYITAVASPEVADDDFAVVFHN